jgi:hypothetical protein
MFGFNKNKNQVIYDPSIDDNSVDPVAEAEVYFAYQRDSQAVEILKEAYATGNEILKERIHQCLLKNNKMDLFNKDSIAIDSKQNKLFYTYRVHWTHHINYYSKVYKANIICKHPKNSLNGLDEIELYISKEMSKKKVMDETNWTISFISDLLQ